MKYSKSSHLSIFFSECCIHNYTYFFPYLLLGVQNVEVDMEKNEIRVKGSNLDVLKIHKQIEELSKKRVELISPKVKPKEKDPSKATDNKPKPTIVSIILLLIL